MSRFAVVPIVTVEAESAEAAREAVASVLREAFGSDAVEPGHVPRPEVQPDDYYDRLRAAWEAARENPASEEMAQALQAVTDERPSYAKWKLRMFEAQGAKPFKGILSG